MIGRLLRFIPFVLVYGCVGTVLALAVGATVLLTTGGVNRDKLFRMTAIIHDVDLEAAEADRPWGPNDTDSEQPSYDELVRHRMAMSLDFDFREQAVERGLTELRTLHERVVTVRDEYNTMRTAFEQTLQAEREKVDEVENLQSLLGEMKPKQAKDQLLIMIDDNAMPTAVAIIQSMPAEKRKKLFIEFKTDEELSTLADILTELRLHNPKSELLRETSERLREFDQQAPITPNNP